MQPVEKFAATSIRPSEWPIIRLQNNGETGLPKSNPDENEGDVIEEKVSQISREANNGVDPSSSSADSVHLDEECHNVFLKTIYHSIMGPEEMPP